MTTRSKTIGKMHITDGQDEAIRLSLDNYDRERSDIIAEGGSDTEWDGKKYYIGSFVAHVWRKGRYRFDCRFETWGNGERVYSVDMKKV